MPVKLTYEEPLKKDQRYVVCPNHFSYLDIPTIGLINIHTVFVGKSAMERIPLFGWMYKRLHITVNRNSLRSKYNSLLRSLEAVDQGKNLVIFPEGGILAENPPNLARFKDGAFRVAIEKQIPIIPVTIYNNWIILDDDLLLRYRKQEVKFHAPVETTGLTIDEMPELKQQVYETIQVELNKRFGNEDR